jgi:hypothetical protein
MRGLWLGVLLLTVSAANAGTVQFASTSTLFGTNDRNATPNLDTQPATPLHRPVGLDGLAAKLGISRTGRLTVYEFTDQPGTDREARFTLGVGGKGLQFRVVW